MSINNAFGIIALSDNKQGAWDFIRYCLNSNYNELGFPTKTDRLNKMIEDELAGDGERKPGSYYVEGYSSAISYHYASQQEIEEILEMMQHMRVFEFTDNTIGRMILEEGNSYFEGGKSSEEVAGIIQGRASIFLEESR